MKTKILFKHIGVFATILALSLSGCSGSKQQQQPQTQSLQSEQQSDKVPEQLSAIEDNIENIFKTLNGPNVQTKEKKADDQGKQEDTARNKEQEEGQGGGKSQEQGGGEQNGGGGEEGGQEQGGEKQGGQGGEDQGGQKNQDKQQTTQKPQPKDPWSDVNFNIRNLHYQWNSYMPTAVKAGANGALIDNFSNALNSLTTTALGKHRNNTLLAASYLYAFVPDLYSLYRTQSSPEIKRIRYYTRNSMLNAMTANWTQAESDINNLKSTWSLYKNTLGKDQQENSNKLDFSISELEKVVKARGQALTEIKGTVAISNIQDMEKAMKKAQGQGEGQAGGATEGGGGGTQTGTGQGGGTQGGGGQ
ncbi:MAG: hypothetical protein N3B21_15445 [Clostridia bacterium]|nr:hypothetical protein [Clostridia bacterium]